MCSNRFGLMHSIYECNPFTEPFTIFLFVFPCAEPVLMNHFRKMVFHFLYNVERCGKHLSPVSAEVSHKEHRCKQIDAVVQWCSGAVASSAHKRRDKGRQSRHVGGLLCSSCEGAVRLPHQMASNGFMESFKSLLRVTILNK